ncbi:aminotransferase class IV [Pseudoalteromonas sp. SR44-5]|jgi:D-alanine transaminase|uniref:D-alanine aminotransferase n=2 Tax=Pseudoalteromonas TaxID=53246 RepID=A0ABY3FC55_9GAMM|nr:MULTISPECIES: aminotransferase class IV [Pseudoalteromonas]MBB1292291.1 aminotransferase class IV [Pseudoalteromonas sp. SR41-4]MBB1302498.1 aminotransferase class IV [Pseudoalteromonas sp. SR44-8]MBB1311406.1 aminotransferase class IV [Pseudoalteromonas sp. SR41-8]MBB1332179.1 aminotransferase class IV [Pseudoalteromonas sp. SR41-6]MBB1365344.1 aminotransferase class IV [Pseudoalteromonas sp. SR44-5]|tara:strand:+ start:4815 stop:5672 length:858 start_codon:yes stop_codon:yes gene_type:complete
MSTVYLNGDYMNAEHAKISPMDRGFLFGDGIYEVIPAYNGNMLGFAAHIERMKNGLNELEIVLDYTADTWREICQQLCEKNHGENLGIYLHVSRGADTKRAHAYPSGITPTVFAYAFEIPAQPVSDIDNATTYTVSVEQDKRWQRCHIKSTALLGNVIHYQHGAAAGNKETILYNRLDELTEASSSNVFIVKDGVISTPPLDNQILPGITRWLILTILHSHSDFKVQERIITKQELFAADEVWITSATKEVGPVVKLNGQLVADGKPGKIWQQVQSLFTEHKFDY